jgi:glycosyltransferase involved in cell wall biosynthesis
MSRKRVVLVCMVDSIHVARWIAQFEPSEVEFTIFPSTPNRRVHSMIKDMMAKNGNIKIVPFGGKLSIPLWGLDLIFSDYVRGLLLRRVIKREQPDFVHALELQHGGYVTSRALEDKSLKTTFIATNYGSDIYWFQQFPKHLAKIRRLLARADRYSAECNRDVELARKYGFTGEVMPVFPNAGGFTQEQLYLPLKPTSERTVIAIKGYEGWVGRASTAMEALRHLKVSLDGYQLVFYSCSNKTVRKLKKIKEETSLDIHWFRKNQLTHQDMLQLLGSSRIYVAASLSDGISTSLLEAMVGGAFPIQSRTACVDDWFENGRTGFSFEPTSGEQLARIIVEALINDSLVDAASSENTRKMQATLNGEASHTVCNLFYEPLKVND